MNLTIEQIGTILALIVSLSGNLFQYLKERKKQNLDSIGLLIDGALKLSKQEIETIRELNISLLKQAKEQRLEILDLEKKADEKDIELYQLRREISILREQLESCELNIKKLMKGEPNEN